jgi:hypothetical protein
MIESAEHGYFGGYLIISALGRPIEFHCTAPVRPSRAQRILYGPTLEPFLLGEQIAGTLLQVAKLTPSLILANSDAALHVRSRSKSPMVLLRPKAEPVSTRNAHEIAAPDRASTAPVTPVASCVEQAENPAFDAYAFQLPVGYDSDHDQVMSLLKELARNVTLDEPFGRIEEAIREAQRVGGGEQHEQAA